MKTQKRRENVLDRKLRGALRAATNHLGLLIARCVIFGSVLFGPRSSVLSIFSPKSLEAFGPSLARGALFFGTTRPKSH